MLSGVEEQGKAHKDRQTVHRCESSQLEIDACSSCWGRKAGRADRSGPWWPFKRRHRGWVGTRDVVVLLCLGVAGQQDCQPLCAFGGASGSDSKAVPCA